MKCEEGGNKDVRKSMEVKKVTWLYSSLCYQCEQAAAIANGAPPPLTKEQKRQERKNMHIQEYHQKLEQQKQQQQTNANQPKNTEVLDGFTDCFV